MFAFDQATQSVRALLSFYTTSTARDIRQQSIVRMCENAQRTASTSFETSTTDNAFPRKEVFVTVPLPLLLCLLP